jgi:hypothetical protein
VAAIKQRAEKPLRTIEEAAMLTTLLAPSAADTSKAGNKPTELTRAIVAALAANATPVGQASLVGLVDGDLPTADDQAAAEAALAALVRLDHADTEKVVLRAIVAPQELRPHGGQVTADTLRKAGLAAVRTGCSARLRSCLATAAIDPQQPGDLRTQLQGFLREPSADNLEAMTVLYGSTAIDAATRTAVETNLAGCSGQLVGRLLRIPETMPAAEKASGATAMPMLSAVQPTSRLAVLWNGDLAAAVDRQLERLESLPSQPRLILLAATIPTDAVRSMLYDALRRNWEDGPQSLTTVPMVAQGCGEPGFWVCMKLLRPSWDEPPVHFSVKGSKPRKTRGTRTGAVAAKTVKDDERLRREWLQMRYSLLAGSCQRLNMATPAKEAAAQDPPPGGKAVRDGEPPIRLHEGARVVSRFDLCWPEDLPDDMPAKSVAATEVKFVHIQQTTTKLKTVVNHYRQQLGSPAEHVFQDGLALWLESHKTDPDSARCRSLDVVITRGSKARPTPDQEEKIAIDILLVEVKDPRQAQTKE